MTNDWIHEQNGKLVSELQDGEIAYTIPWAFIEYPKDEYKILQNSPCMPVKIGTCEVMIQRSGDIIFVRDGTPYEGWSELWRKDAIAGGKPYFVVHYQPLSIAEKFTILWNNR